MSHVAVTALAQFINNEVAEDDGLNWKSVLASLGTKGKWTLWYSWQEEKLKTATFGCWSALRLLTG